jgi:hypothetical protein
MPVYDPYQEWLKIPGQRRPVAPHDLLGLAQGETDRQRILQAATERAKVVRKYVLSPDAVVAEQANRILGEIAAAAVALLPRKAGQPSVPVPPRQTAAVRAAPMEDPVPLNDEMLLAMVLGDSAPDLLHPEARPRSAARAGPVPEVARQRRPGGSERKKTGDRISLSRAFGALLMPVFSLDRALQRIAGAQRGLLLNAMRVLLAGSLVCLLILAGGLMWSSRSTSDSTAVPPAAERSRP